MAGAVTPNVLDSPAVAILCQLERDGFTVQLEVDDDAIVIAPRSRLTPEQMQGVAAHKAALKLLLRCVDAGVLERRDAMRQEIDRTPGGRLPALVYRNAPYVEGRCFSCGDELQQFRFGRCWRCALAWRLAAGVPVYADLARVLDRAKVT